MKKEDILLNVIGDITPEEIQACVDVAVSDSLEEAVPAGGKKATDPRRRWAYSCASVLTAPGFLTL